MALTTSKLAEITSASDQSLLLDVDFFTLEPSQTDWWQEDVRELAAAAKTLAVRLIGERCAESGDVRRMFREHLASLPENSVMRRFLQFVLSQCPDVFKDELKSALFQLFEVERYREIASGAEYEKALQTGFSVLSEDEKQDFVQRTIQEFSDLPNDRRFKGSRILSMIPLYLDENPALKKQVEDAGFQRYPDYEPRPDVDLGAVGEGGWISPRGPIQKEEFGRLTIVEIAGKLRQEWTPEKLNSQNSEADFYNPLNAQGMGDLLKDDIPVRLSEYVDSAGLFFERGVLDQHYTYAYVMGIQEAIKNDRADASEVEWDGVLDLFTAVSNAGESDRFERGQREPDGLYASSWLANWDAVHSAMADVLRELLTEQDGLTPVDFDRHRDRILEITGYLLSFPDPSPADEQVETAEILTGSANDGTTVSSIPLLWRLTPCAAELTRFLCSLSLRMAEDSVKTTKYRFPMMSKSCTRWCCRKKTHAQSCFCTDTICRVFTSETGIGFETFFRGYLSKSHHRSISTRLHGRVILPTDSMVRCSLILKFSSSIIERWS